MEFYEEIDYSKQEVTIMLFTRQHANATRTFYQLRNAGIGSVTVEDGVSLENWDELYFIKAPTALWSVISKHYHSIAYKEVKDQLAKLVNSKESTQAIPVGGEDKYLKLLIETQNDIIKTLTKLLCQKKTTNRKQPKVGKK